MGGWHGGDSMIAPGHWIRHPGRPDWGLGQVQSVLRERVTVNFQHAGKVLINTAVVLLEPADPAAGRSPAAAPGEVPPRP